MLSLKLIVRVLLILGCLIYLASVAIDPYTLYSQEVGWIPSIASWDVYFLTVFVPLSFLYGMFFNAGGRAINPFNKRYANTAIVIIILTIMGGVWFYFSNAVFIPDLIFLFYSNIHNSFSSDLSFLFFVILSVLALPLLCVAIAAPVATKTTLKSLFKWFSP